MSVEDRHSEVVEEIEELMKKITDTSVLTSTEEVLKDIDFDFGMCYEVGDDEGLEDELGRYYDVVDELKIHLK